MTFGIFQFKELNLLSLYIYLTDSKSNKNTSYIYGFYWIKYICTNWSLVNYIVYRELHLHSQFWFLLFLVKKSRKTFWYLNFMDWLMPHFLLLLIWHLSELMTIFCLVGFQLSRTNDCDSSHLLFLWGVIEC